MISRILITDGGRNPVWNQAMIFSRVAIGTPCMIKVGNWFSAHRCPSAPWAQTNASPLLQVWDKNYLVRDERIGTAQFPLTVSTPAAQARVLQQPSDLEHCAPSADDAICYFNVIKKTPVMARTSYVPCKACIGIATAGSLFGQKQRAPGTLHCQMARHLMQPYAPGPAARDPGGQATADQDLDP